SPIPSRLPLTKKRTRALHGLRLLAQNEHGPSPQQAPARWIYSGGRRHRSLRHLYHTDSSGGRTASRRGRDRRGQLRRKASRARADTRTRTRTRTRSPKLGSAFAETDDTYRNPQRSTERERPHR